MPMRVKIKSTGQSVMIDEKDFNPNVFESLDQAPQTQQAPTNNSLGDKVGGLLMDIIKPITNTAQRVGGATYELGRSQTKGMGDILGKLGMSDVAQKMYTNASQTNPFLKTEEDINTAKDPLQIAKDSAGVLAYGVPAIKGSKALGYLTSGGLSGFGASEQDNATGLLGDTALGAGAGLVTGKVLDQFLGGGVGKTGNKLRQGVTNPQVPVGAGAPTKELALSSMADEFGLKGSASAKRLQADKLYYSLGDDIGNALDNSTNGISLIDADKLVREGIAEQGRHFVPDDPTYTKLLDRELKLLSKKAKDGVLTAKDFFEFKQQLAKKISDKTFDEGTTKVIGEGVAYDMWRMMDDAVTTLEPSVKEQTLRQSKLHQLAKGLTSKSKEKIRIPILGTELSAAPKQSAQDMLGRVLQGTGGVTSSVPQAVPQGASILAGMGIVNGSNGSQNPTVNTPQQPNIPEQGMMQAPQANPELQKIVMSLKVLDPKNADMYDSLVGGSGNTDSGLTEPQRVLREKNKTALRAVSDLESQLINSDGTVNKSKVNLSALPGSPGARLYRSNWGSIVDAIGSNRTGAAYTSDQRKDYAHLLPVIGDSDETVKQKILNLRAELQGYAGQ